jgi:hypothetical protein
MKCYKNETILDENNPKFVCGRPLGMAFDVNPDNLIVMDTSNGIYELNMKTGEKRHLVSEKAEIGSNVRTFFYNKMNLKTFSRFQRFLNQKSSEILKNSSPRVPQNSSIPSLSPKTVTCTSLTPPPTTTSTKSSWLSSPILRVV